MSKFQMSQLRKGHLIPFYIALMAIVAPSASAASAASSLSVLGREKGLGILEAQANTLSAPALPVQITPSINQPDQLLNTPVQTLNAPVQKQSSAQQTRNTPILTPTVPVIPPPGTSSLPQQPTPNQIQFPFNPPHTPTIDNNFNSSPISQ